MDVVGFNEQDARQLLGSIGAGGPPLPPTPDDHGSWHFVGKVVSEIAGSGSGSVTIWDLRNNVATDLVIADVKNLSGDPIPTGVWVGIMREGYSGVWYVNFVLCD